MDGPQTTQVDSVEKPPWIDSAVKYWPLLLTMFSFFALGVRADAQINSLQHKVAGYDQLIPQREGQMGRIDERLSSQEKRLERMEAKIDRLLEK